MSIRTVAARGVALAVLDAGLADDPAKARIWSLYSVPLAEAVHVKLVVLASLLGMSAQPNHRPSQTRYWYLVMALLAGSFQVRMTCRSPGFATRPVGATGACARAAGASSEKSGARSRAGRNPRVRRRRTGGLAGESRSSGGGGGNYGVGCSHVHGLEPPAVVRCAPLVVGWVFPPDSGALYAKTGEAVKRL